MKTRASTVSVRYLPLVTCQICQQTLAHQPGEASTVLTRHYAAQHGDTLQRAAR